MAGALGGGATGIMDGVWSWQDAAQFAPDFLTRVRWLLFLGASYALTGAVIAAVVIAAVQLGRIGTLWRFALRDHAQVREATPTQAVVGLSLALVGPPLVIGALMLAHHAMISLLVGRKEFSLTLLVMLVVTLATAVIAVGVVFVAARVVEAALTWIARHTGARRLSSLHAPQVVVMAWAVLGGVLAWRWSIDRKVPLQPALGAGVVVLMAIGATPLARRLVDRLAGHRRRRQVALVAAAVLALEVVMLLTGNRPSVIQASTMYSSMGGPIARAMRRPLDLDRDGYAGVLAGGDCDDFDASIHPGAVDIPGDGIDQNCAGGDAAAGRPPIDLGFVPVPASVPADFNVLLVTIDTLRADHLGAYGYRRPTSPTIDAIAAGGTRFANAWAHAPSTRYSMPALLTGRLPLDVFYDHSIDGWPGLLPRATTIAEALATRGLTTGAITNYWYFDEVRRMNQGFASYDNKNKRLHTQAGNDGPKHTRGSSSKEQTDKAIEFVDGHAAERFMLWVHYYDPHAEYEAHPEVPSFGSEPIDLYDGEIRFTDFHLARLVADLKARGLYDKTIIVITGDHGEGFGEHGVTEHGYNLYAAQTRVPLIIRVPGLAPRVATTPAGHIDIMPTLVNLAGGATTDAISRDMMGRSLVDVLAGAPDVDRPVFQQLSYENHNEMRAAASQQCHVIYNVSPSTSWETYRVDRDPDETQNLDADAAACGPVRAQLEVWYDASQIPAGADDALMHAAPMIAAPLGVYFGDEVELLAVELPPTVKPGEPFTVTWTFAAHGALADGWKVFAHFENGKGGVFRGDHAPPRPLSWWRDGQFIRYASDVTVPRNTAIGTYTLWTGVWQGNIRRPARGGRAGVTLDDNRASVGTIQVVR